MLTGERRIRQILRRRAGTDGIRLPFAAPREMFGHGARHLAGNFRIEDGLADPGADIADLVPILRLKPGQPIHQRPYRFVMFHGLSIRFRRHAKTVRHLYAFHSGQFPQAQRFSAHERKMRFIHFL